MGCCIGVILYVILQFIAFLFILVGTPIDMYRGNGKDVFGNTPCLTMWGEKEKCYSTKYGERPATLFKGCGSRVSKFKAAEAFAIINIVVYGVACILGFVQLCCCRCLRWLCLVLNIIGITAAVTWGCMADMYSKNNGPNVLQCAKFKTSYKYGAGFALFVTGWCLDIINIIFIMLPC